MPVSNTYIRPQDGWVEVVAAPAFIRITGYPETHPFYVFKGDSPPTDEIGGLLSRVKYVENVDDTDTFYVRVASPMSDGPMRIDTFWIDGTAPPAFNSLNLESGSTFLALEDGSSPLLLES